MAVFDTYRVLDDSETLSAGQQIKFDIQAFCPPFAAPSDADVAGAFQNTSMKLLTSSADVLSFENGATITARINEVIAVGQLRAQILSACQAINAAKSIPCFEFSIVGNEIDLLTAAGSGVNALPSANAGLSALSLAAVAVIAIVAWAFWRDLTVI